MRPIPIAQYLSQLEGDEASRPVERRAPRRESLFTRPRLVAASSEPSLAVAPPAPDIEARIAEAYERGAQDGRVEAQAEQARREAEREAELEARLEKEREALQTQEYSGLADALSAGLEAIEERIAGVVARILQPYLEERQARLVVGALCADIDRVLSADAPPLLRISGPEEILATVRQRLSGRPIEVEYWLSDGVEVTVKAQATQIETQLQSWTALISTLQD